MPAAVHEAVRCAVKKIGERSKAEAVEYVTAMDRDGRLIEECGS